MSNKELIDLLRRHHIALGLNVCKEAADALEAMEAENARQREALQPFKAAWEVFESRGSDKDAKRTVDSMLYPVDWHGAYLAFKVREPLTPPESD